MRTIDRLIVSGLALASIALVSAPAEAKSCFKKAAIGDAISEDSAKFQVDEALLQATDWGAWASWMATGTTPGYTFGRRTYRCKAGGGLGWECHGVATLCKL